MTRRRIKRLHYLMESDGKQAEFCVVAFESCDQRMMEVVRTRSDPHTATAHLMWKVPADAILAEHKLAGHSKQPDDIAAARSELGGRFPALLRPDLPRTSTLRQAGKVDNHAGNYREGPEVHSLTNSIPLRESKFRIHAYSHIVYPGLPAWWVDLELRVKRHKFLVNPLGRKLPIMGPTKGKDADHTFKQACAAVPQSTVHDVVMLSQPQIIAMGPDVRLASDNHDSNTTQHWIDPRAPVEECAARILHEAKAVADAMTVE